MAEAPGDDIAKYVAENIGVQPLVQGAGKMGGSLIDLLTSLLSGAKGMGGRMAAPPPAPPPQAPGAVDPMQAQQGANPLAALMQGGGGGANNFMALLMKLLGQQGGQ